MSRLPLYLRVLGEAATDSDTISSEALAARAGVNAAQVRKDLSHLGSYGIRGVGYDVDYLIRQISRRLGLEETLGVVVVGTGHLGQALVSYGGFPARGFHVVAAFDSDPAKVGIQVGATVVEPVSAIPQVISLKGVDIAVIATPASAAQGVADTLVAAGVRCILNFAPTTVAVPDEVVLRQVDLGVELQILSFYRQRVMSAAWGA